MLAALETHLQHLHLKAITAVLQTAALEQAVAAVALVQLVEPSTLAQKWQARAAMVWPIQLLAHL
jgi:hypothetical protein